MLSQDIRLYRSKKISEDLAHLLLIFQIKICRLRCIWEVIYPFQPQNHQGLLKNLTIETVIQDRIVKATQCLEHIQTNLPTIIQERMDLLVDHL